MKIKWLRNALVLCAIGALIYLFYATHGFGTYIVENIIKSASSSPIEKSPYMKYALIWTSPKSDPIIYLGNGSETFHQRNCSYKNCFITSNRNLLRITDFDTIIFHGPEIMSKDPSFLPGERSANQSYIFASMESSHNYKVPDSKYNDVFNFTWTYKLNSDINFAYMVIRDEEGNIVGPNATVPWISIDDMLPINETIEKKLANKSIAAAWFVSNCNSYSQREKLAQMVIEELKKHNMTVDVYGRCGKKQCPRNSMYKCLRKIQRDYYFYFAFENSFSEDYVTEKLLHGLQNYAVPVVYGGADYKRFMPDGTYLKVTNSNSSVVELVNEMVESIRNKKKYNDFFKWHNHYSYHSLYETPETDPFCSFCSFLNNVDYSKVSVVNNFYKWWNQQQKEN